MTVLLNARATPTYSDGIPPDPNHHKNRAPAPASEQSLTESCDNRHPAVISKEFWIERKTYRKEQERYTKLTKEFQRLHILEEAKRETPYKKASNDVSDDERLTQHPHHKRDDGRHANQESYLRKDVEIHTNTIAHGGDFISIC